MKTSWADVAGKAFDFLQHPTGWSVLIVALVVMFMVYATPMAVMAWVANENTNRLERAISALGTDCLRPKVAVRVSTRMPE